LAGLLFPIPPVVDAFRSAVAVFVVDGTSAEFVILLLVIEEGDTTKPFAPASKRETIIRTFIVNGFLCLMLGKLVAKGEDQLCQEKNAYPRIKQTINKNNVAAIQRIWLIKQRKHSECMLMDSSHGSILPRTGPYQVLQSLQYLFRRRRIGFLHQS